MDKSVKIDSKQYEEIKKIAKKEGRHIKKIIYYAIEQFLRKIGGLVK